MLVCDHAGREIPAKLGRLGVDEKDLLRHIAWDIGAGALCSLLSHSLDAVSIRQRYSRLVVDCNRGIDSPQLMVKTSDGALVPGNAELSDLDIEQRLAEIYRPYHEGVAAELAQRVLTNRRHVIVLMHSFTPNMNGFDRPWRVGVLHLGNSPLSSAMLTRLRAELGDAAGDNEPYAMDGTDYTAPRHASETGFDYLELEIRQDLICDSAGQTAMANWLAPLLREVVHDTDPAAQG